MTWRGVLLAAGSVLVAIVLQLTVVNPLHLPWGGPLLPILVIVPLASMWGPTSGSVIGFAAGMLLDIAPPANGPLGLWAGVFAVVGYICGLVWVDRRRPIWVWLAVVAATSGGAVAGYGLLTAVLGSGGVGEGGLARLVLGTVLYDLLLTPLVVPGLAALARRSDPTRPFTSFG